jgi:Spy/CpxP family protein refolding chaperone
MTQAIASRLACWMTLISLAVACAAAEQPAVGAKGGAPVKKGVERKGRHRLPAHYAKVVSEKQRQEIYRIEDEYQPKIEALQKQLDALKGERDAKIAALLTAEQKKQIEEAAARAKANRKSKRQTSGKTAEGPPATPPTAPSSPPTAPPPAK